jgi:NADH-quinone oxidoreductase subunit F
MRAEFLSLINNPNSEVFTDSLDSDFIIIIGMLPSRKEGLLEKLNSKNIVYMSVIEDKAMTNVAKIQSRYEAGSEEGVLAILAKELLADKNIDEKTKEFFENLDEGYISAETNVGEEELEEINELYKDSKTPLLLLGEDFYAHPRKRNIARIVNLFVKYGNFKIYDENSSNGIVQNSIDDVLEDVEELESFDGSVVYTCTPKDRDEEELLIGSAQFMMAAKLKDGDEIFVITQNAEHQRKFVLDSELKGTVALLPSSDGDESYNYKVAKIIKRES